MLRIPVRRSYGLGQTTVPLAPGAATAPGSATRQVSPNDLFCPAAFFPPPGVIEKTFDAAGNIVSVGGTVAVQAAGVVGKGIDIGGKVVDLAGKVIGVPLAVANGILDAPGAIVKWLGFGGVPVGLGATQAEGELLVSRAQAQAWASQNQCQEMKCRSAMTGAEERFYSCAQADAAKAQQAVVNAQAQQANASQMSLASIVGIGGLVIGGILLVIGLTGKKD